MAPQVRLELTTLRLHFAPNFRLSVDYLINFLSKVVGRYLRFYRFGFLNL
jgi:hypothetical protein